MSWEIRGFGELIKGGSNHLAEHSSVRQEVHHIAKSPSLNLRHGGSCSRLERDTPVGLRGVLEEGSHGDTQAVCGEVGASSGNVQGGSAIKSNEIRGASRRKTASVGLICYSGSSGSVCLESEVGLGEPDLDADIRNCNNRLLGNSAGRITSKVWNIGKSLGVIDKGNQSSIIEKPVDMENRDREAVGNMQASNGKDTVS